MPTFIDILKAEAEESDLKKLFEPPHEPDDDDNIVGEADDDLKRLYHLAMKWQKKWYGNDGVSSLCERLKRYAISRSKSKQLNKKIRACNGYFLDVYQRTLQSVG